MAVSARLRSKTPLALTRYCKAHGLTKTQALERGAAQLRPRPRAALLAGGNRVFCLPHSSIRSE
jgi:hypothetical protein